MAFRGQYEIDLPDAARSVILKHAFEPLKFAQKKHERCDEVDDLMRRLFVAKVLSNPPPVPTTDEMKLLKKSLAYLNIDDSQYKRIRGSLKAYPSMHMFLRVELTDEAAWGKSYGDVDESAELVLAWNWFLCSYERVAVHRKGNGDLIRQTDATLNSRTQVFEVEYKMAATIANRYGVMLQSWFQLEPSSSGQKRYAIAFETVPNRREPQDGPFTKNSVKAVNIGLYLFEEVAARISKFTMIQKVDMGGQLPTWLVNALAVFGLSTVSDVQKNFKRTDRVVDKVSFCLLFYILSDLSELTRESLLTGTTPYHRRANAVQQLLRAYCRRGALQIVQVFESKFRG